ncbi:hypothetical protein MMC22_002419 [Lobaria immixta]|nr:hypothetical protein [Lobaria immixta]
MAYPGTLGTPFFDGRNFTDFLEQYKDLCADYRLSSAGKKSIIAKMLRDPHWPSANSAQTYNSHEFLEAQRALNPLVGLVHGTLQRNSRRSYRTRIESSSHARDAAGAAVDRDIVATMSVVHCSNNV